MNAEKGLGTVRQVETASEVLARLSESSDDGRLRDAIGLVRGELYDLLDEADRRKSNRVLPPADPICNERGIPESECPAHCRHDRDPDDLCLTCGATNGVCAGHSIIPPVEPIRCATRCSQWPDCRHDWTRFENCATPPGKD